MPHEVQVQRSGSDGGVACSGAAAAGCVTAVMGYVSLRRGDHHALSPEDVAGRPIAEDARTAVVMPICNEDVATVVAGLRATIESLSRAGSFDRFDVYMLSDTGDLTLRDAGPEMQDD